MTLPPCDACGHPVRSHRYGGANPHGSYTYLSSCRKCACDQYIHPEDGERRRE